MVRAPLSCISPAFHSARCMYVAANSSPGMGSAGFFGTLMVGRSMYVRPVIRRTLSKLPVWAKRLGCNELINKSPVLFSESQVTVHTYMEAEENGQEKKKRGRKLPRLGIRWWPPTQVLHSPSSESELSARLQRATFGEHPREHPVRHLSPTEWVDDVWTGRLYMEWT